MLGQFIESIGGKAASFRGTPVDGSTFAGENAERAKPQITTSVILINNISSLTI